MAPCVTQRHAPKGAISRYHLRWFLVGVKAVLNELKKGILRSVIRNRGENGI